MGGRGAYWKNVGQSAKKSNSKEKKPEKRISDSVIFEDGQLGKKIGKHAKDYGLDPRKESNRRKFLEITKNIIDNHEEKRTGSWRGQTKPVTFYARGNDVVIISADNEYISTLKDGVTNKKYQEAKKE